MCYAIPGKIVEIDRDIITVEYFGEKRKARNEFFTLASGDYVYAQAGFVVQKIPAKEALPVLEAWRELFFKLQEVDLELSQKSKGLYQRANFIRQKYQGNSCCIHGIIEFSNYCRNDCLYCGIRNSNSSLPRYRMNIDEIAEAAESAVNELNFKALVLQSGEDTWYDEEKLIVLAENIRARCECLLSLSIGERNIEIYERLYEKGVRGVLLRFETGNESIYSKMRPNHRLEERISLIKELRKIGFLVMTGFIIGLPDQSDEDIISDIKLAGSLGSDMFSFGPFIPHPNTPLAGNPAPSMDRVLETIAKARIMNPEAKILVTTSMETLYEEKGLKLGLLSGGNSLMINVTPARYRKLYEIYPNRAGIEGEIRERISQILTLLHSIGRAPSDLGI